MGVRPNSPAQTISVSSSMPRCFRSRIRAAQARSISWALSSTPCLTPPWWSQSLWYSWMNRTPRSARRRASRQLDANEPSPGLHAVEIQDMLRFLAGVHQFGHAGLHAEGHLVLGDPGGDLRVVHQRVVALVDLVDRLDHVLLLSVRKRRAGCSGRGPDRRLPRSWTPWNRLGRKPADHCARRWAGSGRRGPARSARRSPASRRVSVPSP